MPTIQSQDAAADPTSDKYGDVEMQTGRTLPTLVTDSGSGAGTMHSLPRGDTILPRIQEPAATNLGQVVESDADVDGKSSDEEEQVPNFKLSEQDLLDTLDELHELRKNDELNLKALEEKTSEEIKAMQPKELGIPSAQDYMDQGKDFLCGQYKDAYKVATPAEKKELLADIDAAYADVWNWQATRLNMQPTNASRQIDPVMIDVIEHGERAPKRVAKGRGNAEEHPAEGGEEEDERVVVQAADYDVDGADCCGRCVIA